MDKALTWLNGKKTYATAIAILACGILTACGVAVPEYVWAALAALGLGFLRVGVKGDGVAKMMLIPLALGLMLSAGCYLTEMTPEQRFECEKADVLSARHGFDATATVVVTMIESGQFTPSQARQVRIWMRTGFNVLNAWDAAVRAHEPTREIKQRFDSINRDITAAKIAAERRTSYIVRSTAAAA